MNVKFLTIMILLFSFVALPLISAPGPTCPCDFSRSGINAILDDVTGGAVSFNDLTASAKDCAISVVTSEFALPFGTGELGMDNGDAAVPIEILLEQKQGSCEVNVNEALYISNPTIGEAVNAACLTDLYFLMQRMKAACAIL